MSENKPNKPGGVRRVGEKDRKNRLEASGPLFPPEPVPPTVPEADPVTEAPVSEVEPVSSEAEAVPLPVAETNEPPLLDDDTAALLAEIESGIETAETDEVEEDDAAPEEADYDEYAQFRRPAAPVPYDAPKDRFPPLPDEQPLQLRLKAPPRVEPASAQRKRGGLVFNCLTLIFLLGTCALIGAFAYLWQNPYSALNPFPPFTPPPIVVTQTFTPTLTLTPTATLTPTLTPTPLPTNTPTPVATDTPETAAAETAESTEAPGFAFSLRSGQTIYITNPDGRGGCRWSSIAGTVSGANGGALNGYQIRVLGDGVDETAISGTASGYGPGGFEVQLGNEAVDAEYAVQLFDPNGVPVSDVLKVSTSSRCDWNISVLRFVQN